MPMILAIETATEACSAALLKSDSNNDIQVIQRFELAPREHTKLILPMLDEVLQEGGIQLKEVDAIAFGCGPGAFTGLRIAAGVAQGIALSVDKPVIPISTLAALAQQVADEDNYKGETIIAALDARMEEVYWGTFKANNQVVQLIGEERVSKPQEMLSSTFAKDNINNTSNTANESTIGVGIGWDVYADELTANETFEQLHIIKNRLPTAEYIARLALPMLIKNKVLAPELAQPVYIRNNVAKKSQK